MVECTALEMRRTGNRTVGSNPTLSATFNMLIALDVAIAPNATRTNAQVIKGRGRQDRSAVRADVRVWVLIDGCDTQEMLRAELQELDAQPMS